MPASCNSSSLICLTRFLKRGFCVKKNPLFPQIFLSRDKKKMCNFVKLQLSIYSYTKKHLALDNLAKLVFCAILLCKNWSFSKLLSFFVCQFLSWEKIWENWENFLFTKSQPELTHHGFNLHHFKVLFDYRDMVTSNLF